jgi:hypothetical protein
LIVAGSLLAFQLYLLGHQPVIRAADEDRPDISLVVLLIVLAGTAVAATTGSLSLFLGGELGRLTGFSGTDYVIYRLAGAATLASAFGGLLILASRRWREARFPLLGGFVFNALSAIAAALEISRGGPPFAWLILAGSAGVAVLVLLALIFEDAAPRRGSTTAALAAPAPVAPVSSAVVVNPAPALPATVPPPPPPPAVAPAYQPPPPPPPPAVMPLAVTPVNATPAATQAYAPPANAPVAATPEGTEGQPSESERQQPLS